MKPRDLIRAFTNAQTTRLKPQAPPTEKDLRLRAVFARGDGRMARAAFFRVSGRYSNPFIVTKSFTRPTPSNETA